MTNGHAGPKGDPKPRYGIDPSFVDWVLVVQGMAPMIGKASGGEAAIRAEMEAGQVPTATLTPVYAFASSTVMMDLGPMGGGVQPRFMQIPMRLGDICNLGRAARPSLNVVLTAFVFLSALDPATKAHVFKLLTDYEQASQAATAGVVLAGR